MKKKKKRNKISFFCKAILHIPSQIWGGPQIWACTRITWRWVDCCRPPPGFLIQVWGGAWEDVILMSSQEMLLVGMWMVVWRSCPEIRCTVQSGSQNSPATYRKLGSLWKYRGQDSKSWGAFPQESVAEERGQRIRNQKGKPPSIPLPVQDLSQASGWASYKMTRLPSGISQSLMR